ncbi:MAG: ArsR family transcriptional regulator [Thermoplasmatales archaeon]|nr:MAG: ArsR family transcriptional regulator [Thermoplasmatales archaeon]
MDENNRGLELKTRRTIYNHILKNPGLHEREIARQLKMSLSTLDYHLFYLKKKELIIARPDRHYTQYYVAGNISTEDKKILAALRQRSLRRIVIFLLLQNSSFHREICNHLELAPSTTSFHLNKLVELGVIERNQMGRETEYSINRSEHVSDLIIRYKKSFLDNAVNHFADTWMELHPRHLKKSKK